MIFRLWHFTSKVCKEQIQEEGGFQVGERGGLPISPCFSLPGERHWEPTFGPALVEVWFDFDEMVFAGYKFTTIVGGRVIPFYKFLSEEVNAHAVQMRFHDHADELAIVSEDPCVPDLWADHEDGDTCLG